MRTVKEYRQLFLLTVGSSVNAEADNATYETCMQDMRVDDAMVEAESTLMSLQSSLNEVQQLIESYRLAEFSDVTRNDQQRTEATTNLSASASDTSQRSQPHSQPPPLAQQYQQMNWLVPPPNYLNGAAGTNFIPSAPMQPNPTIQLSKLKLEPFSGDITQFSRFWCAFELAVHNDPAIAPIHKFLYLQNLLKGEAQMVLQDLDPEENNYYELVRVLKKRYDRPHKTRAMLHKQLQQLPQARSSGSDLRNTWFRISGILHGLRKYEDFRTVLPLLDLVKGKFPSEIRQRLHDLEFQTNSDFDLDQVMQKLDYIIASREKYEDSTTLEETIISSSAAELRAGTDIAPPPEILVAEATSVAVETTKDTVRQDDTSQEAHLATTTENAADRTVTPHARHLETGTVLIDTVHYGVARTTARSLQAAFCSHLP
ncbi:unnamed protein product [Heligmosomoides polygyrus]|uniref:Uncharacterized protein n=1 Tax=Heligmosomoides polygyrus TaxID=6339 RepID=A0A183FA77_HELPZ|nr:unnamed protein product [Heligmosomoides polygyrus]